MNIFVVVGHPDGASFSHALAAAAVRAAQRSGHSVLLHDLYAEAFQPVISALEARDARSQDPLVEQHCTEVARADGIIVVHPNWWGQPPAIMKGWIDRVLRPGVAYDWGPADRGEGVPIGLLRAGAAVVLNTANTPWEREVAVFGNPLDTLWRNCIFGLCGVARVERRVYGPMATSTLEERSAWLHDVEALVRQVYP
jgi:NAD(P)H dehydrogenase (quinone)